MTDPAQTTQQEFLRDVMRGLNMTREQFAKRLGMESKKKLDRWLLPSNSPHFCEMPDIAWSLLREIIENEGLDNI